MGSFPTFRTTLPRVKTHVNGADLPVPGGGENETVVSRLELRILISLSLCNAWSLLILFIAR